MRQVDTICTKMHSIRPDYLLDIITLGLFLVLKVCLLQSKHHTSLNALPEYFGSMIQESIERIDIVNQKDNQMTSQM